MKRFHLLILVVGISLAMSLGWWLRNFSWGTAQPSSQSQLVLTSILPLSYFADRLTVGLDNDFKVAALVPSGYSPETYEPTPQQAIQISQAKVIFQIGLLPVETTQLKTIVAAAPGVRVVNIDTNQDRLFLPEHHDDEAGGGKVEHHEDEKNGEDEIDPHTWLDPVRARQMVVVMKTELLQLAKTDLARTTIEQNWQQLDQDLARLDTDLQEDLAPLRGAKVLVYHPELGYLGKRYGFTQVAIEVEGKEPSLVEIQQTIEQAKAAGITTIFVQPQYSAQAAETIAQELKGTVIKIDPLAYDYLGTMKAIAKALQ